MELLNCPFCGSSNIAEVKDNYNNPYGRYNPTMYIACKSCHCRTEDYPDYDYKKAFAAWNRRQRKSPLELIQGREG